MSWLHDFQDAAAVRERAVKALSVQVGLAHPFWLAYGAAAGAGAAWWLMASSWKPVNLEALGATAPPAPEPAAVDVAPTTDTVVEAPDPVVEAMAHESSVAADDLTRLVGVGPRTAAALVERGVATFADLAAWTAEDMAAFDADLKLKGRSLRDAWLDQARALAAG